MVKNVTLKSRFLEIPAFFIILPPSTNLLKKPVKPDKHKEISSQRMGAGPTPKILEGSP
jgi:hypothetical protein